MRSLAFFGLAGFMLAFGATICVAADSPKEDQPPPKMQEPVSFDGTWEGTIKFDKEAFLVETSTPVAGTDFRIEISGPIVRVFPKFANGTQNEFMEGALHIAPVMANAVIFGTHFQGIWAETWTFTVSHKEDDTLLVNFVRVVNNRGYDPSDQNSAFSTRGVGIFKRVKSP